MRNLQNRFFLWRRSLLTLLLMCLVVGFASAQQITVKGKVSSAEEGPLPGVNITIQGTTTGTATDIDGAFTIVVPGPEAVLLFAGVGYTTQSVTVGSQTTLDVVLVSDVSNIGEVVVTGYGTQKRATVTGAVSDVKGAVLLKAPVANISNSLVGRISGLMVVNTSGEPGDDNSTIRIRGINTLNNSAALVVIDGIANRDGGISRINPNDIESITVLKDASAAIYGAQAANGVIMVTTKRGKVGAPEVALNMNFGMNQPTRLPSVLDAPEYATILNELDENAGRAHRYTDAQIAQFADGSDPFLYPNTNWYTETIKPWSPQNNLNVTLNGGTEAIKYFVSAGSVYQDAIWKNSAVGYKQYNFRTNIDAKLRKNIKLRFDVSGRQEKRQYTQTRGGSNFRYLIGMKPTEPAFWPQRSTDTERLPGPDFEGGQNPAVTSTDITGYVNNDNYVFNSNIGLDLTDLFKVKGLSAVGNVAFDQSFREEKNWRTPWTLYYWDKTTLNANNEPDLVPQVKGGTAPSLSQSSNRIKAMTANFRLNYVREFGDNSMSVMAGVERSQSDDYWFNAYRNDYVTDQLEQLSFGANNASKTNDGLAYESARLNYFGRVNYDYKDKYLAEFVWRYDGSAIFDPNYRWGFFPGVSAGWVMSEENFMSNVSFVNRLKLRGSYGTTGNDAINPYQYLASFEFGGNYIFNEVVDTKSIRPLSVPNQGVTWEVAKNANLGIEGNLLDNKISFEFDVYKNTRSNILLPPRAGVPDIAGFDPPDQNIGEIETKGFDLGLSYNGTIKQDIIWSIGFNGGYSKNKVLFWDEPSGVPEYQLTTGKPMSGTFDFNNNITYLQNLLYQANGVFKDSTELMAYPHWPGAVPGDIRFEDVNNDGKIDGLDRKQSDKSSFPTFVGGINLMFAWKGFEFTMLLQGATGAQQYLYVQSGEFGNYLHDFADGRWTKANPNGEKPRAYNREDQYWIANHNTYFMRSTNYLRGKNMRLAYTLPENIVGKAGIKYAQVYFSAINLFTIDTYKVFDPENDENGGARYPQNRTFNFGVNLTF